MRVVEESEKIFEYVDGWKRDGKFSHDIKEDIRNNNIPSNH